MNRLDVDRLMEALSEILSDKYSASIVLRVKPKETESEEQA